MIADLSMYFRPSEFGRATRTTLPTRDFKGKSRSRGLVRNWQKAYLHNSDKKDFAVDLTFLSSIRISLARHFANCGLILHPPNRFIVKSPGANTCERANSKT